MRINVPIGQSLKIVDSKNPKRRVGFSIQNVGASDVFYSDDQRLLDSVGAANLPVAGHLLAAAAPVPPPVVYPWFANGQIFVRAQAAGALLEIVIFEVDVC
jgi:hypothetical protein